MHSFLECRVYNYKGVFCIIQQLDSVVVGTENARRYFKGIAGNRKRYGELFGIKNMFQLHAGDITRTMDILKVRTRDITLLIAYHV